MEDILALLDKVEIIDVGDKKQVEKGKRSEKIGRERELWEIQELLKTNFGKGFIWRILEKCHMSHTISHHDSLQMARMSGERDIGLWLINELRKANPNAYIELIKEQQKRDDK
jgi:hypothetical protein